MAHPFVIETYDLGPVRQHLIIPSCYRQSNCILELMTYIETAKIKMEKRREEEVEKTLTRGLQIEKHELMVIIGNVL